MRLFFVVVLLLIVVWGATFFAFIFVDATSAGSVGDTFGITNCLFSAVALAAIILTIRQQQDQLGLQREELRLQREEMIQSRHELARTADAQRLQAEAILAASLLEIHYDLVSRNRGGGLSVMQLLQGASNAGDEFERGLKRDYERAKELIAELRLDKSEDGNSAERS